MERDDPRLRRRRTRRDRRGVGLALTLAGLCALGAVLSAQERAGADEAAELLARDAAVCLEALGRKEDAPEEAWTRLLTFLPELPEPTTEEGAKLASSVATTLYYLKTRPGPWSAEVHAAARAPEIRRTFDLADMSDAGGQADWIWARELIQTNRLDEGETLALRALDAWVDTNFAPQALCVLLADLYRKQERWDEARSSLERADELLPPVSDEQWWVMDWRITYLGVRGQLELSLGRLDRAQADFEAAEALAARYAALPVVGEEAMKEIRELGRMRAIDLLLVAERYDEAVQELDELIPRAAQETSLVLRAQLGAALVELEARDPDRTRRARELLEELASDAAAPAHVRLTAELELVRLALIRVEREGDTARIDAVPALLLSAEERLTAWQEPMMGRPPASERALLSGLAVWHALLSAAPRPELERRTAALEEALGAVLDSYRATPVLPDGIGFLHLGNRRSALGFYLDACRALDDDARGLALLLRADALGSFARGAGLAAPDLDEVRAALAPPGSGLLIVLPTLERTHVFAFAGRSGRDGSGGEGILHELGPPLFDVLSAVGDLRRDLKRWKDPSPRELARLDGNAARVAEQLLPARIAARLATWDHVSVVGAQYLSGLELEVLPLDGERLGLAKAVSYLPSLTLGVHLARRWRPFAGEPGAGEPRAGEEREADGLFLVVADDVSAEARRLAGELLPLPFDDAKWERLVHAFPDGRVDGLRGANATRAALLAADLSRARVLHVFAHGVPDPARELPAGLALRPASAADSGLLFAPDLVAFAAPDVVILSACGTARGKKRLGEDGVTHLGGAFLERGAEAVVLAAEDVEYAATLRLSERLHEELARGAPLAEALRRARVTVSAEFPHPFYWSQLRVFGIGFEPVFRAR